MNEYVTQAFVLDTEPAGENNLRVHLFTKELGRVSALARSARKPSAKLAAHIQPLTLVTVRLVERRGFQLVDALSEFRYPLSDKGAAQALVDVCQLIKSLTDVYQPDKALWQLIEEKRLASRELLKILGFDPAHARCSECGAVKPEHFIVRTASYVCKNCLRRTIRTPIVV